MILNIILCTGLAFVIRYTYGDFKAFFTEMKNDVTDFLKEEDNENERK